MEFVHSTVKFDADRDEAGEKGYSGEWDPSAGVNVVALAALMDARFEAPLTQIEASTGRSPAVNWTAHVFRRTFRRKISTLTK